MARGKVDRTQKEAHCLLQEWGSGPAEYAEMERLREHVDGDAAALTAPEIYAAAQAKWNSLDRAVRHVYQMSRELGMCLYEFYRDGYDEQECAERAHTGVRTWRDRMKTARAAFLAAHQMLPSVEREAARDSASRA